METDSSIVNTKRRAVLGWVLRIVIGLVFVLSALSKLVSIDHFELYIYSFGFFSLNACFLLARLCIGMELVLALLTLLGVWPKKVRLATFLVLIFFSLFLCYAALAGRNESCQCFGKLVDMNPGQSLLKNAVLLALVIGSGRCTLAEPRKRVVKIVAVVASVVLMAVPFVVSVPDNWMFGPGNSAYNAQELAAAMEPGSALAERGIGQGECLVAFVTPGCPYCRMTREKIDSMVRRHGIDSSKVHYLEPNDIGMTLFMNITYGARPLVLLMDGPQVKQSYHFRNINEKQIVGLLAD